MQVPHLSVPHNSGISSFYQHWLVFVEILLMALSFWNEQCHFLHHYISLDSRLYGQVQFGRGPGSQLRALPQVEHLGDVLETPYLLWTTPWEPDLNVSPNWHLKVHICLPCTLKFASISLSFPCIPFFSWKIFCFFIHYHLSSLSPKILSSILTHLCFYLTARNYLAPLVFWFSPLLFSIFQNWDVVFVSFIFILYVHALHMKPCLCFHIDNLLKSYFFI